MADKIEVLSLKIVRNGVAEVPYAGSITSADTAFEMLKEFIGSCDRENFVVLILDTKNYINAIHTVSTGTLNSTIVHPREVFKLAVIHNAASIIVGHNHPSGDTTPSTEDIQTTDRLIKAGDILGIKVLDHIIVGDNNRYCSFKQRGLI